MRIIKYRSGKINLRMLGVLARQFVYICKYGIKLECVQNKEY